MKKILSIVAFMLLGMALSAHVPSQVTVLAFQVGYTDPTSGPTQLPSIIVETYPMSVEDY